MNASQKKWYLLVKYLAWAKTEWNVFAIYGITFSLLSLAVPFSVQLLVNNLALAGLQLTLLTITFMFVLVLIALQFCHYAQIVLVEYLERKLVCSGSSWFDGKAPHDRIMYFELMAIPKNLSKWALDGFEIALTIVVGTLVLMMYHPLFLLFAALVFGGIYVLIRLGLHGLDTAVYESKMKYNNWFTLDSGEKIDMQSWLKSREIHFKILKRQIKLLMTLQIVGHVGVLLGGALLFEANSLTLGQFVSAEIIGNGVFFALAKMTKFLETHYALMTSLVKIEHTRGEDHE